MTPRRLAWAAFPLLAVGACAPQPSAPPQQALVCPPDPPAGSGYRCAPPPPAPFCKYLPAISAASRLLFGGNTGKVADDLIDAANRLGCPQQTLARMTLARRRWPGARP